MIYRGIAIAVMIAAGIVPSARSALAQDVPPPAASSVTGNPHRLREMFEAANTTHDGRLTLAQAQAGSMSMVARNFSAIDADHKGYVTLVDIHRFKRARRAMRTVQTPAAPQWRGSSMTVVGHHVAAVAIGLLLIASMLIPTPAAAWGYHGRWGWHAGYARHPGWGSGWRGCCHGPGVLLGTAPVVVVRPPVIYVPLPVVAGPVWIRPHWNGPYWVGGHWR